MNLKIKKILGIDITISSSEKDLEEVWKCLKKVQSSKFKVQSERIKPLIIYTPNPEIISFAQKDHMLKRVVNTAQINLPDGTGVVWAIKKLYGIEIRQIAGIDFMLELAKMAARESLRIGLIGGRGGLAVETAECLRLKHQNLKIDVFDAPEIEIQNSKVKIQNYNLKLKIIDKIINKKTDILFVGLGFPKQEYFIDLIRQQLAINNYQFPIVLMAVGGAFDYISGRIRRAPLFIRNLGLEWLFRLIREPSRLPRQLKGAAFFLDILTSA